MHASFSLAFLPQKTPFDVFGNRLTSETIKHPSTCSYCYVLYVRNFSVQPGTYTKVSITPRVERAGPNLRTLDIEDRSCRFPEENEGMSLLQEYSFSGCVFECMLEMGRDTSGCTPWNYPHPAGKTKVSP